MNDTITAEPIDLGELDPMNDLVVILQRYTGDSGFNGEHPGGLFGVHVITLSKEGTRQPVHYTNRVVGLFGLERVRATMAAGTLAEPVMDEAWITDELDDEYAVFVLAEIGLRVLSEYVRWQVLPIEWQSDVPWGRVAVWAPRDPQLLASWSPEPAHMVAEQALDLFDDWLSVLQAEQQATPTPTIIVPLPVYDGPTITLPDN